MDYTLNELSLAELHSKEEVVKIFMEISDVASALNLLNFKSMKIWNKSSLLNFEFYKRFSLITWFKYHKYASSSEKDRSSFLRSVITKKDSIWNEEQINILENLPVVAIQLENSQPISEGLKIAFLNKTIAVSFNTDKSWDSSALDLICLTEAEDNSLFEQTVTIRHVSRVIHIDDHKDILSNEFDDKNWNPSEELFPRLSFSNMLVNNDWSTFRSKIKTTQQEKEAVIRSYGTNVAKRNGYLKDKRVSELNTTNDKKRIVYGAGSGKYKIYLSLDLEKGGFEVCDYLGIHIGEYFFDGIKMTGSKSGHNLFVKS